MLPTVPERLLARYLLNTPVSLTQAIPTHFLLPLEYLIISQNRWKVTLVSDRWIPFPLFCARKFSCVGRIFVGPCDRGAKVWSLSECASICLLIWLFWSNAEFSFFLFSSLPTCFFLLLKQKVSERIVGYKFSNLILRQKVHYLLSRAFYVRPISLFEPIKASDY